MCSIFYITFKCWVRGSLNFFYINTLRSICLLNFFSYYHWITSWLQIRVCSKLAQNKWNDPITDNSKVLQHQSKIMVFTYFAFAQQISYCYIEGRCLLLAYFRTCDYHSKPLIFCKKKIIVKNRQVHSTF